MSKRIAFDVEDSDLRNAIEVYAKNRGMTLAVLARSALFSQIRRNKPSDKLLLTRLQRIL